MQTIQVEQRIQKERWQYGIYESRNGTDCVAGSGNDPVGGECMIIRIDELSDVPIYQQIRNQIVMGISGGELGAGEQLPTVRALALEMGINTMTVSKAYQLLKTEGYIMTDRKNGARVRTTIDKQASIPETNKAELRRIVSEAHISGVPKEEILRLVEEYYR